jgi:DNA polymerase elongation subunit (family B)
VKLLHIDIETAPHMAAVWGLWGQNVGLNQLIKPGYTLCFAAKWHGSKEVHFHSIADSTPKQMVKAAHKLLSEADAVCHYNGRKFDIPTLNKEFLLYGLAPPTPSKQIDLLTTARSRFRLASNKLDYLAQQLGLGRKEQHKGFTLWLECMAKDPAAWEVMRRYNIQDVMLLEKVYDRLKPWIKGHPNLSTEGGHVCPHCESERLQRRGYQTTLTKRYARWQCRDCGTWSQSVVCEPGGAKLKEVA